MKFGGPRRAGGRFSPRRPLTLDFHAPRKTWDDVPDVTTTGNQLRNNRSLPFHPLTRTIASYLCDDIRKVTPLSRVLTRSPHKGESSSPLRGAVYAFYYFSRSSRAYAFCLCLLQYAQETQHEKILRGLAVGIAFTMYGRLEEADPLVTSLCADKDPILRRSGMYTLAMAYCGTGNNQAIRKLLHVAVSDSKRPPHARRLDSFAHSLDLFAPFTRFVSPPPHDRHCRSPWGLSI